MTALLKKKGVERACGESPCILCMCLLGRVLLIKSSGPEVRQQLVYPSQINYFASDVPVLKSIPLSRCTSVYPPPLHLPAERWLSSISVTRCIPARIITVIYTRIIRNKLALHIFHVNAQLFFFLRMITDYNNILWIYLNFKCR